VKIKSILLGASVLFGCLSATAQENVVPSCSALARIEGHAAPAEVEIFVAVDQTTPFDAKLKQQIADNVRPFLVPGKAFTVFEFSAFVQGHYVSVLTSGQIEAPLDPAKRDDIPKQALMKFDQCLEAAPKHAAAAVGKALKAAFEGSSTEIRKSDIIGSLKEISGRVKQSSAKDKIVFVASDMLENSSISSFYLKNSVMKIDPDQEMKKVAANQMFGDFGGARVFVLGAGLIQEDKTAASGVYRDPKTMASLESFWRKWFAKSNANLVEFGSPALVAPVR